MELDISNNNFQDLDNDMLLNTEGGSITGWILFGVVCLVVTCTTSSCRKVDNAKGNK